jgi:hypothetical protein
MDGIDEITLSGQYGYLMSTLNSTNHYEHECNAITHVYGPESDARDDT